MDNTTLTGIINVATLCEFLLTQTGYTLDLDDQEIQGVTLYFRDFFLSAVKPEKDDKVEQFGLQFDKGRTHLHLLDPITGVSLCGEALCNHDPYGPIRVDQLVVFGELVCLECARALKDYVLQDGTKKGTHEAITVVPTDLD